VVLEWDELLFAGVWIQSSLRSVCGMSPPSKIKPWKCGKYQLLPSHGFQPMLNYNFYLPTTARMITMLLKVKIICPINTLKLWNALYTTAYVIKVRQVKQTISGGIINDIICQCVWTCYSCTVCISTRKQLFIEWVYTYMCKGVRMHTHTH